MKIDKRLSLFCVLDVEACNTAVDEMRSSLVYDLGYAIVDKQGNVYRTRNFVIYEIYVLEKELMKSAYYADKLPQYEDELKDGTRQMVTMATALKIFRKDCKEFGVKAIIAHNARFDYNALQKTLRYVTKSEKRYFFPYGIAIWDSLKMANDTICKQKLYRRYCEENNYLKKNGEPRATAEILYRYIANNDNFIEKHTGLEDVLIEKEIFVKCLRQHKRMRKNLFSSSRLATA
jgi:DNA polymerase III epsilon subunit-like protein